MNHRHQDTVVIGAGIAGLAAAWRLHEAGIPVTVLEQTSRVGGCVNTTFEQGYLLELGPNTFLNSSKRLWDLADSVGLKELKIETPPNVGSKRYIFKKKSLYAIPGGPAIMFSPILSLKGRLRILKEPLIKTTGGKNESLADFVRRRFGDEVLQTLVAPLVSGIHAGDTELLSVRAIFPKLVEIEQKYGSVLKGLRALKSKIKSGGGLGSFRAGMGTLPMAIESRLPAGRIIKTARATKIARLNGSYSVSFEAGGEENLIIAKNVVCATPAYAAARLLPCLSEGAAKLLAEIIYAPLVVIHTAHKEADIPYQMDGFGFLVPRKQRVRILGSLWSSTLFKERADKSKVLLTNFLGGMLDREACDLSNDDIVRIVHKDLARTMGIKAKPEFACITRYTHAIPQYNIGHTERIASVEKELAPFKGLHLTGAYFTGTSVAGAVEHATSVADKIIRGPEWTSI